jgi:flagellar basal-body rod protein FlgB
MEPISAALILRSLDGLAVRATVTAQNIANANTTNYRPLKVSFEDLLRAAMPKGVDAIAAVRPRIDAQIDGSGRSDLRLDLELATATATAGRYGTLVELLNRQMQLDALAASGAR